jgi:hypothetical protein
LRAASEESDISSDDRFFELSLLGIFVSVVTVSLSEVSELLLRREVDRLDFTGVALPTTFPKALSRRSPSISDIETTHRGLLSSVSLDIRRPVLDFLPSIGF